MLYRILVALAVAFACLPILASAQDTERAHTCSSASSSWSGVVGSSDANKLAEFAMSYAACPGYVILGISELRNVALDSIVRATNAENEKLDLQDRMRSAEVLIAENGRQKLENQSLDQRIEDTARALAASQDQLIGVELAYIGQEQELQLARTEISALEDEKALFRFEIEALNRRVLTEQQALRAEEENSVNLAGELNASQGDVDTLTSELGDVRQLLTTTQDALEDRDLQLSMHMQETVDLKNILVSKIQQIDSMEMELIETGRQLVAVEVENEMLHRNLSIVTVERDQAVEDLARNIEALTTANDVIERLEADLDFTKSTVAGFELQLSESKGEIERLGEVIVFQEAEKERIAAEREYLANLVRELESTVNELEVGNGVLLESLRSEQAGHAETREQLQAERGTHEETADRLVVATNKVATLEAETERLNGMLIGANEQISELKTEVEELKSKLDAANGRIDELEIEAGDGVQQLQEANDRINALDTEARDLTVKFEAASSRIAALEAELEDADAEIEVLVTEIDEIKEQLERAITRVDPLIDYRDQLRSRVIELIPEYSNLQAQSGRVTIPTNILFQTNSARLSVDGEDRLQAIAEQIKDVTARIPEELQWVIRIDGHTDSIPVRKGNRAFADNLELSAKRAQAVLRFLSDQSGIPMGDLTAAAFGEHRPVVGNATENERLLNRRIELGLSTY